MDEVLRIILENEKKKKTLDKAKKQLMRPINSEKLSKYMMKYILLKYDDKDSNHEFITRTFPNIKTHDQLKEKANKYKKNLNDVIIKMKKLLNDNFDEIKHYDLFLHACDGKNCKQLKYNIIYFFSIVYNQEDEELLTILQNKINTLFVNIHEQEDEKNIEFSRRRASVVIDYNDLKNKEKKKLETKNSLNPICC